MMTVRLIAHTPEPEKVVAAAAKLCYSDAHITDLLDGLDEEKTAKFLTMLSDQPHSACPDHPAPHRILQRAEPALCASG